MDFSIIDSNRKRMGVLTVSLCLLASPLAAQAPATLAQMNQDIQLLAERIGRLTLRVDVLERENEQLKRTLEAQVRSQNSLLNRFESYSGSLDARIEGMSERERQLKREIISEVSDQIRKLAAETQKAIDALARAQSATPQVGTTVQFSEDYPQEGIAYTVQPGDTLSAIARRHNSTVRDIQNANRIARPSDLQAGRTIFIPQRNPQ